MKANDWLKQAEKQLKQYGVSSARLDALILLEDETSKDRSWLLAHPEHKLDVGLVKNLKIKINRRSNHEPLAYIRGKTEFYGREFLVTPATLQPRPETETMLELFNRYYSDVNSVIDIGTGSGAIAITAKLEHPNLDVYATEINQAALDIAKSNAKNLSSNINFFIGNLLEPIIKQAIKSPTAILANLPYVPNDFTINESAMQEPRIAIFGGNDGLDLYREMFIQASNIESISYIFTESLPFQNPELAEIALKAGYKLIFSQDLIQVFIAAD